MVKDRTDPITAIKQNLLKVLLSTALLTVFLGITDIAVGQGSSPDYLVVRFIIEDLQDQYHASELDEQLMSHPDIWMSRSDHNTRNYLGFFDPETDLEANDLRTMLSVLGLDLKCYTADLFDGSPIEKLDPRNCDLPSAPNDAADE